MILVKADLPASGERKTALVGVAGGAFAHTQVEVAFDDNQIDIDLRVHAITASKAFAITDTHGGIGHFKDQHREFDRAGKLKGVKLDGDVAIGFGNGQSAECAQRDAKLTGRGDTHADGGRAIGEIKGASDTGQD